MTTTYAKLDSMILDAIETGQNTYRKMLAGGIEVECKRIAVAMGASQYDLVLDRRVQALRRAKKIMYQDRRWSVIKALGKVDTEEATRMQAFAARPLGENADQQNNGGK
ncbi:hypothetical protein [Burkholderia vietnamiensis]|uniref:hypothetical protein n=1 Tax=Burkholderia vietnamiensis TaxID=60552 RepID=UPI00158F0E52|nr:hypothetical protein [Burkholderia vietnamiensis]